MAAGAIFGGYAGAGTARRIGQKNVRRMIILIGIALTLWLLAAAVACGWSADVGWAIARPAFRTPSSACTFLPVFSVINSAPCREGGLKPTLRPLNGNNCGQSPANI